MANNGNTGTNGSISPNEGEVKGRTYNSQNPSVDKAAAKADISAVDQQEGTMTHGETGPDVLPGREQQEPDDGAA